MEELNSRIFFEAAAVLLFGTWGLLLRLKPEFFDNPLKGGPIRRLIADDEQQKKDRKVSYRRQGIIHLVIAVGLLFLLIQDLRVLFG